MLLSREEIEACLAENNLKEPIMGIRECVRVQIGTQSDPLSGAGWYVFIAKHESGAVRVIQMVDWIS